MPAEARRPGVIGWIIAGSARNPLITILLVGGLAVWAGCRCAAHRSMRFRICPMHR